MHENETACRTHFHMKGFALRLVLKQRHKRTQKWPIPLVRRYTWPQPSVGRADIISAEKMTETITLVTLLPAGKTHLMEHDTPSGLSLGQGRFRSSRNPTG